MNGFLKAIPTRLCNSYTGLKEINRRTAMNDMFGFGLLVGVCAFAIPGLRRTKAPLALLLLAIVVLIVGCGGGSGTGPSNPGTPAGTYAVTLTATSGSVSAPSITFQVTVQ